MTHRQLSRLISRDVHRLGGISTWLLFRCLPALVLAALSILLLASGSARAQSVPGDVEGGQLFFSLEGGEYRPAVTQSSRVHMQVSGLVAVVTLEQRFSNVGEVWAEGVYAFPLPEDAAVRYMEIRVGERRIVGRVRERAEAREVYRQAQESGRKASLVEQQRPNLFTNRVANIGPGEEVSVLLEYVQPVAYSAGTFSLRLPTTATPRYMPGSPLPPEARQELQEIVLPTHGWAVGTDQVPDAAAISPLQHPAPGADGAPLNPVEITARLDLGIPLAGVESPYHDIAMSRSAGVYDIRLAAGVAEMDRDFVLRWQPLVGSAPVAALFTERVDGEFFGLLMMLPPAPERAPDPLPREVIFVVDTSGSMDGVSIRQARQSLDTALGQLRPGDSFNVIEFNSRHRSLFPGARDASRHNVQLAREFVRHLDASGGTEMLPALLAALSPPSLPDEHSPRAAVRQVIFITDGAVGNETALFDAIVQHLGASRLFTVGIGSAPNSWFMRKAAEYGRGSFTYIADVQEVGDVMSALFAQLSSPAAVDLALDWPDGVEAWPGELPDLYLGQALFSSVRFGPTLPAGSLAISGRLGERAWSTSLLLPGAADPESVPQHPGVASLWARSKIDQLLDERHRGRTDEEVRGQVLPLALKHQLMSPYTSFVAVEEQVSRPESEMLASGAVPNTRPRGQAPQTYAYPRTATTAPANVWLGSLALLCAVLVRAMRQGGDGA